MLDSLKNVGKILVVIFALVGIVLTYFGAMGFDGDGFRPELLGAGIIILLIIAVSIPRTK
jgi:hypothetical protein